MVIIEDSRQKPAKNAHIKSQIESLGHRVIRSKMLVGDYQISNRGDVVVDTKFGMGEVESNLIHDHERFRTECEISKEAGIQLIVLIQDSKLKSVGDVFGWYNFRKKFSPRATSGRTLAKIMMSMSERYGVRWEFATRENCGKRILELLGGE